tara:strand:- start:288 stop:464 length:177 start_codon:yes stop_codon:yes gene_type:complete
MNKLTIKKSLLKIFGMFKKLAKSINPQNKNIHLLTIFIGRIKLKNTEIFPKKNNEIDG